MPTYPTHLEKEIEAYQQELKQWKDAKKMVNDYKSSRGNLDSLDRYTAIEAQILKPKEESFDEDTRISIVESRIKEQITLIKEEINVRAEVIAENEIQIQREKKQEQKITKAREKAESNVEKVKAKGGIEEALEQSRLEEYFRAMNLRREQRAPIFKAWESIKEMDIEVRSHLTHALTKLNGAVTVDSRKSCIRALAALGNELVENSPTVLAIKQQIADAKSEVSRSQRAASRALNAEGVATTEWSDAKSSEEAYDVEMTALNEELIRLGREKPKGYIEKEYKIKERISELEATFTALHSQHTTAESDFADSAIRAIVTEGDASTKSRKLPDKLQELSIQLTHAKNQARKELQSIELAIAVVGGLQNISKNEIDSTLQLKVAPPPPKRAPKPAEAPTSLAATASHEAVAPAQVAKRPLPRTPTVATTHGITSVLVGGNSRATQDALVGQRQKVAQEAQAEVKAKVTVKEPSVLRQAGEQVVRTPDRTPDRAPDQRSPTTPRKT